MSAQDVPAVAVFAEVWGDTFFQQDLGPTLTCREAEALSDLFLAFGLDDAAYYLIAAHAAGDDEGDQHFGQGHRR